MTPENLGAGSGMNHDGDVVPIHDIEHEAGYRPRRNEAIIEDAREASKRLFDEMGAVASNVTIDHDGRQKVYPRTAEQVIAERKKRAEQAPRVERDDPYSELGGGLRGNRDEEEYIPLENVLDDSYESWQSDIRLAVEQFGLAEFTASEIQAMNKKDFELFCLHFYNYLQSIDINRNLIIGAEARTDVNPQLRERYGDRSPDELKKYARVLENWLKRDLEKTGLPELVRKELHAPAGSNEDAHRRSALIHEASQSRKRHHGTMHLVKVKDRIHVEWSAV